MKNNYLIISPFLFILFLYTQAFAQPLSGTYTIGGANPSFTTLKAAVDTLVSKGVSGQVIFSIRPGIYNERLLIPAITGASATNTVTFRSSTGNADDVAIIHAGGNVITDHHVIMLKGARHIILEKLTIKNTGKSYGSGIHLTLRSDSNTIKYCKVIVDSLYNETYATSRTPDGRPVSVKFCGIIVAGIFDPAVGTQSGGINVDGWSGSHNTIRGNTIRGQHAIMVLGSGAKRDVDNCIDSNKVWTANFSICTWMNDSVRVADNELYNIASSAVNGLFLAHGEQVNCINNKVVNTLGRQYTYLIKLNKFTFENNILDAYPIADAKFSGLSGYVVTDAVIRNNTFDGQYIIGFSGFDRPGFVFHNNNVDGSVQFSKGPKGLILTNNRISCAVRTVTSSADGGILLWACADEAFIANNMVLNKYTGTTNNRFPVVRFQGKNSFFVHNTVVSHTADLLQQTTTDTTWWYGQVFGIEDPTNEKVLNNIFINRNGHRAFHIEQKPQADFVFDYNVCYSIGDFAGTYDKRDVTLNDLKRLYGQSEHSFIGNPVFNSPSDLHLTDPLVDGRGLPLSYLKIDIDSDQRDPNHSDIGADEFQLPAVADLSVYAVEPLLSPKGSVSIKVTLENKGAISLKDSIVRLAYSLDSGSTWSSSEQVILTSLQPQYALQSYVFNSVWNASVPNKYDVCVRIESPGVKNDADKTNDMLCGDLCIVIPPGVYTIDNSGAPADFSSITEAVSWLAVSPICGIGGPVVFNIRPGEYKERVSIPLISGTSSINSITFQSATGKAEDVIISNLTNLIGTSLQPDNVNIAPGTSHISFKDLTFSFRSLAGGSCAVCFGSTYYNTVYVSVPEWEKSDHIRISGCVFRQVDTMNLSGLVNAPLSISGMGSGTVLENNTFYGARDVLLFDGDSIVVKNNRLYNTSGIKINRGTNIVVSDNTIIGVNPSVKGSDGAVVTPEIAILLVNVNGGIVTRNTILKAPCGIRLQNSADLTLCNNTLASFSPSVASSNNGQKQYLPAFSFTKSGAIKLLHNSVSYLLPADQLNSLVLIEAGSTAEIYNNIFYSEETDFINIASSNCLIGSDHNDWYRTTTNAATRFGLVGTAAVPTLSAWRAFLNKDRNSISVFPEFLNDSTDLHTNSSQLDKAGTYRAEVRYDMDGESRSNRFPDIGADEFVIDLIDLAISGAEPKVGYLGDNQVSVTLSNEGLNSLSGKQVNLSFSPDGSSWSASEQFTITGLNATHQTQQFTFNAPYVISKTLGNRLYVRISTPIAGDAYSRNDTLSTPVCVSLTGNYAVGSGAPYFPDLNSVITMLTNLSCGISGPVVFELESGMYLEEMSIPFVSGMSEANTLTFRSKTGKAEDVLISSGYDTPEEHYTVQILETAHVRLENLTIENTGKIYATGVHLSGSVKDVTITGCIILCDSTVNVPDVNPVLLAQSDIYLPVEAENLLISNNRIIGGYAGVRLMGFPDIPNKKISLLNNTIRHAYRYGIYSENNDIDSIAGNKVYMDDRGAEYDYGLLLYHASSAFHISNNLFYRGGVYIDQCYPFGKAVISNNMISGKLYNSIRSEGLYVYGSANLQIAHNSIHMESSAPVSTTAFRVEKGSALDLRNNIFYNALPSATAYAISVTNPSSISYSDHNNLFTKGSKLANWEGSDMLTLSELRDASGKEQNSLSINPGFISASDLHTLNPGLEGHAQYMPEVPSDYDGQTRDPYSTDIGADEYTLGTDAALTAILNPADNQTITAGDIIQIQVQVTNAGSAVLTEIPVIYTINEQLEERDTIQVTALNPGSSTIHSFSKNWVPLVAGPASLCVSTELSGDNASINNEQCQTYDVQEKSGLDIAITEIIDPGTQPEVNQDISIKIRVANPGNASLTANIPLKYYIDGVKKTDELFQVTLNPGDSKEYTFIKVWKPTATGPVTLCVKADIADTDLSNNELCKNLEVQPQVITDGGVTMILSLLNNTTVQTDAEYEVRVRVYNFGNVTLSNVPLSYSVNGTPVVTEITPSGWAVDPLMQKEYIFTNKWDPALKDTGQSSFCAETGLSSDDNNANNQYCITVKVKAGATGVEEEAAVNQLQVYPNPAVSILYLRWDENHPAEEAELRLYNGIGACVLKQKPRSNPAELDISHLPGGMYILELHEKKDSRRAKIIITGK